MHPNRVHTTKSVQAEILRVLLQKMACRCRQPAIGWRGPQTGGTTSYLPSSLHVPPAALICSPEAAVGRRQTMGHGSRLCSSTAAVIQPSSGARGLPLCRPKPRAERVSPHQRPHQLCVTALAKVSCTLQRERQNPWLYWTPSINRTSTACPPLAPAKPCISGVLVSSSPMLSVPPRLGHSAYQQRTPARPPRLPPPNPPAGSRPSAPPACLPTAPQPQT